jgi:hypothetical protein
MFANSHDPFSVHFETKWPVRRKMCGGGRAPVLPVLYIVLAISWRVDGHVQLLGMPSEQESRATLMPVQPS